jgi:hypothetical protein
MSKLIEYGKRELAEPEGNGNIGEYFLKICGFELLTLSTNPFLPEIYEKLKEAQ